MKKFIQVCTKQCADIVQESGFKQSKNVFWRIVGDMYQTFYVETFKERAAMENCRIGFCVIPLCARVSAEADIRQQGLYYLKKFEPSYHLEDWQPWDGWRYNHDEKLKEFCCKEITRMLKEYLIPFFERTSQSKTALSELIALEALFDDNRLSLGPGRAPAIDATGGTARLNKYDPVKYYLAVKAGDFDFALDVMESVLRRQEESFRQSADEFSGIATTNGIEELIDHLKSGDMEYILKLQRKHDPLLARVGEAFYIVRKEQLEESKLIVEKLKDKDVEYFRQLFRENEEYSRNSFNHLIE